MVTFNEDGTAVRLGATPSNDKAKDIEPDYAKASKSKRVFELVHYRVLFEKSQGK